LKQSSSPLSRMLISSSLALLPLAISPSNAYAEPASNSQTAPNLQTDRSTESNQSATPALQRDFSTTLADRGIYLRGLYNMETTTNVSGGIKRGQATSQYALIGTDIDLKKLVGWSGAKFHASIIDIDSRGLNHSYIGGGIDSQENYADFNLVRFVDLSLEQSLSLRNDNDLTVQAGMMGMATFFGRTPYGCLFTNHAFCGSIWGLSQTTGTASAPLATWGARATYRFTPYTYATTGVFMSDTSILSEDTKLFDIRQNDFTGRNWLGEIGQETTFANDAKPYYVRVGGWHLDAPRNNVYYNTQGRSVGLYGGTKEVMDTGNGYYITAGKVISRDDAKTQRNLAVFASFINPLNEGEPIAYTAKAGVVKTGTFAGRDRDTLAFAFSDTRYSDNLTHYLDDVRTRLGSDVKAKKHEYTLELAYGFEAMPGVTISPNIQYEINPTTRTNPTYTDNIDDPLILGVKLVVNFGALAKLPTIGR